MPKQMRLIIVSLLALVLLGPALPARSASLQTFPNSVNGTVRLGGAPLPNARVRVTSDLNAFISGAFTDSAGRFSVPVPPGSWTVEVEPDPNDAWMFTSTPPEVVVGGTGPVSVEVALTVQAATATVRGRLLADGAPLPLTPAANVLIELVDTLTLASRMAPVDINGDFTAPVVPGVYEASVFIFDPATLDRFDTPPAVVREVNGGLVDFGTIALLPRDATISGRVLADGRGVDSALVTAVRADGGYTDVETASDGSYSLRVSAGEWELSADAGTNANLLDFNASTWVTVEMSGTARADLTLATAAAELDGRLQVAGTDVTDASGWAYARDAASGEYVAYEPFAQGRFRLAVPAGNLLVGVLLADGSPYALARESELVTALGLGATGAAAEAAERRPFEQAITVPRPRAGIAQALRPVTVELLRNDAQITGTLRDATGRPLFGVAGLVSATPLDAGATPQQTQIDPLTGAYRLRVSAGVWLLSYSLGTGGEEYVPNPIEELQVLVAPGATVVRELIPRPLDGVIAGRVVNEQGQPIEGVLVWLEGNGLDEYALSEEGGLFDFAVPLLDGGSLARYNLGILLSCPADGPCYLSGPPRVVQPQLPRANQNPTPTFDETATAAVGSVTVRGTVKVSGSARAGVSVIAGTPRGRIQSRQLSNRSDTVTTAAGGRFSASVPVSQNSGRLAVRALTNLTSSGTAYEGIADGGVTVSTRAAQQIGVVELTLEMREVATLPASVTDTFVAGAGWRHTLSDGTSVEIPPGAVPAPPDSRVRVVVEPATILDSERHRRATFYGYTIALFDASTGARLSSTLRAPALLTLRYNDDAVWANDVMESRILPARQADRLWLPVSVFSLTRGTNRVSLRTTELGTWALVEPADRGCGACVYLPLAGR